MGFELDGGKRSYFSILMTPGPIVTMIGLLILIVSVYFFSHSSSGNDLDAMIAAQTHSGARLKSMLGMVVGIVVSIAGVLWSLLKFHRS